MTENRKTIEECVVAAMDGSDKELYPYLPYILQDLWEIGASPDAIIRLIRKHWEDYGRLNILDPGCGKGVVSVKIAAALGCRCHGIDAIPEFIDFARRKADEYNVGHLCTFETGDIRETVKGLSGYDIVILGAIGPVFGDYVATLTTLSHCIVEKGAFIVDDGYIEDDGDFQHPSIFKKSELMKQIDSAGMTLVENDIMEREDIKDADDHVFGYLEKRCRELIEKYPGKRDLFLDYIEKQKIENDVLENKIIGTTMLIKPKKPGS